MALHALVVADGVVRHEVVVEFDVSGPVDARLVAVRDAVGSTVEVERVAATEPAVEPVAGHSTVVVAAAAGMLSSVPLLVLASGLLAISVAQPPAFAADDRFLAVASTLRAVYGGAPQQPLLAYAVQLPPDHVLLPPT